MLNDKIKACILVLYLTVYVCMCSHSCPCKEISHASDYKNYVLEETTFNCSEYGILDTYQV